MKSSTRWFVRAAGLLALLGLLVLWRASEEEPTAVRSESSREGSAGSRATQAFEGTLAPPSLDGLEWTLGGRVTSAAGEPLEGARVCATLAGAAAWMDARLGCALSGANGRYELHVAPGAYALTASREGFVPQTYADGSPVRFDGSQKRSDLNFALESGGALLRGVVIDVTGGPIPDAQVTVAQLQPSRITLRVSADDEGAFQVAVHEGQVGVSARAPGYSTKRTSVVAPTRVELRLVPAGSIRGRVVAARDGEPKASIEVRAKRLGSAGMPIGPVGRSDREGQFEIEGLAADKYLLTASGGEYRGQSLRPVEVPLAGRAEDVVILLQAGTEVRGKVVTQAGEPCPRGFVGLGAPDPTLPPSAVRPYAEEPVGPTQRSAIQGDGTVVFPGVPDGFYHVTVLCIGHVLQAGPRVLRAGEEQPSELHWTVAQGAELRVRVVDAAGRPAPATTFGIELPGDTQDHEGRVLSMRTDTHGETVVPGLQEGSYVLHPPPDQEAEPVSVRVRGGDQNEAVLRLRSSSAIEVRVRDHGGEPVDGLRVHARALGEDPAPQRSFAAKARGLGRYYLGPLPAGHYRVGAADGVNASGEESMASTEVEVSEGASARVSLTLPAQTTLTGRVSSAEGEPLANVWVSALSSAPDEGPSKLAPGRSTKRVLTDFEGRFELNGLTAGARFDLRADDPEGGSALVRDILASPGSEVAIRLPETCVVRGVVVDAQGQPVTQYQLRAFTEVTLSAQTQMVVHGEGAFEVEDVTPGEVTLTAMTRHAHGTLGGLALEPGEHREGLRVVLEELAPPHVN